MYIVHVIPLKKGIPFDTITYFWTEDVAPGTLVKIPFNNRTLLGLVLKAESAQSERASIKNAPFRLKKLSSVVGSTATSSALVQAILNTHALTLAPLGTICAAAIAPILGEISLERNEEKKERRARVVSPKPSILIAATEKRFEQYKSLVRGAFAQDESVCFVAPTIHDATMLHAFLSKGMSQKVMLLHSGLSLLQQKERIESSWSASVPRALVVTVPYLCMAVPSTAKIIIEKESSDFYRTSDRFAVDMRLFIKAFAVSLHATLLASDTLVRFETIASVDTKTLLHLPLLRNNSIIVPEESKKEQLFSKNVELAIKEKIEHKQSIWILAHRKGIAPLSRCKDCGTVVTCPQCSMPLVLKQKKNVQETHYICTHCGFTESASTPCRMCKSWNIFPLRIGSEAIIEYFAKNYFDVSEIITHDRLIKHVTNKHSKNSKESKKLPIAKVYIGTEAMLPYIETIDLALIPFFDRLYATPSYEMTEHILRTVFEASEHAREVVIVSKQTKNDLLTALKRGTLRAYIGNELGLRKSIGFPPYGTLLRLTVRARAAQWPDVGTVVDALMKVHTLQATPLALTQSRQSSMQLERSWIIQTTDGWIQEQGEALLISLEQAELSFTIERNPHYFV